MRELETNRLILRKLNENDAESVYNNWANDPEVTKWLTWEAHNSVEVTKEILSIWLNDYDNDSTYRWGIELKKTHELIGMIDVCRYMDDGNPEIGYVSGRKFWGNGYMTEAFKAVIEELLSHGFKNIYIRAVDNNIGSNRVIEKCGFQYLETHQEEQKNRLFNVNSYKLFL